MTIQFLGIAYQLYNLSSKTFDREIRLRCSIVILRRNERHKARVTLEWQKVTEEGKERDREKRDEIRRDRDLRAKARGITI